MLQESDSRAIRNPRVTPTMHPRACGTMALSTPPIRAGYWASVDCGIECADRNHRVRRIPDVMVTQTRLETTEFGYIIQDVIRVHV